MRLLLVAYFYEAPAGGGIIVARMLREQLSARGHQVDVLCLDGSPETQPGTVWRLPRPAWLPVSTDRFRQVLLFLNQRVFDRHFLNAAWRLPLAQQRYDFVLAQDFLGMRVARDLAERLGVPCGGTLHDTLPQQVEVGAPNAVVRGVLRRLSRRRDADLRSDLCQFHWLAAVSRHVQVSAQEWLGSQAPPIDVFHDPVPPAFAGTATELPPGPIRFLFVGRLSPEKGIDVLVDAFRQIPGPQRLTVIGLSGSLAGRIRQAAAADARIELRPAVPYSCMPEVYAAHHVVCCPVHWNEPFGLTVLEGRVTRRAVMGTRQGGLPEILEGYPRAHLLEPATDRARRVQSLATALSAATDLVQRPLDLKAEANFLRGFELSTVVDRYEERIRRSVNTPTAS